RGGRITILNTDTAEVVASVDSPDGTSATHPAWSPNGQDIVFAAGSSTMGGVDVSGAGLARVRRGGDGEWGEPEWLIESGEAAGSPENLFYPAFSPDGRWL